MSALPLAFLQLLTIFIAYPWLAAVIGALFVARGRRARRWGVVTIGVVWVLYAGYETGMQQRWLCSGDCNIRVDLLFFYPILLLATLGAVVSLRHAREARRGH